jgi:large subunit ribosomal protein L17
MRHRKRGRHLGRNASHRRALLRNLACALIAHERIVTTVPKAKELRPFVERLITLAKRNTLHARRLIIARLGGKKEVPLPPDDKGQERDPVRVVAKLFDELAPRYRDRPGGYTRILKRHQRRLGDAGQTAYIELLQPGEEKRSRPRKDARKKPKQPRVLADTPAASESPSEPSPAPASSAEPPAENQS